MSQRLTIAEIAAAAGVSIPPVSKVLNQRPDVATTTRERIERIILESGYVHNRTLRALDEEQKKQPKLIDLISPGALDFDYCLEILTRYRRGFELDRVPSRSSSMHKDTPRERQWLAEVSRKTAAGAFLFTLIEPIRHLEKLRKQHIPFVVIDDVVQLDADIPSVGLSNRAGALLATEYLLDLGHQRIAIIMGIPHPLDE